MSYQSRQRIADQSVTFVTPASSPLSSRPSLRHRLATTLTLWPARRGDFTGRSCL